MTVLAPILKKGTPFVRVLVVLAVVVRQVGVRLLKNGIRLSRPASRLKRLTTLKRFTLGNWVRAVQQVPVQVRLLLLKQALTMPPIIAVEWLKFIHLPLK